MMIPWSGNILVPLCQHKKSVKHICPNLRLPARRRTVMSLRFVRATEAAVLQIAVNLGQPLSDER